MISMEIGVVVIGRNEGSRLVKCLESLRPIKKFTVYVDSGSTDGSALIAQRFGSHLVALDQSEPFTAARARNEGFAALRKLRPDIGLVQFIDGDCELDQAWLDKASKFMTQRGDVAIVSGRRREQHPSRSLYNRLFDLEWDTPVGQCLFCGGDSLVRVDAFDAVGGFRAQLIAGEEPELCLRLREKGWKIWRLDVDMTRHDAAMEHFGQWWIRGVRSGYGLVEVARLHWRSPLAIWKKELARSVVTGGALPVFVLIGLLIHPLAFAALLAYPLQVCRIAIIRGAFSSMSWVYAAFVTLAKFAEVQGIVKFYWRGLSRQTIALIEYK